MPRRHLLSFCAAIGIILAAAATPQDEAVGGSSRARVHSPQPKPIPSLDAQPSVPIAVQKDIKSIASSLGAINARTDSDAQHKYDQDYLQAQKGLADWAGRMFWVAIVEILVTFTGVVLVGLTLRAARDSATQAGRAADAASDQAAISNSTFEEIRANSRKELRAYLSAEPAGINRLSNPNEKAVGHVVIRNVGRLPAKNVYAIVSMVLDEDRKFSPTEIPDNSSIERSIQPGAHMRQGSKAEFPIDDIKNAKNFCYVWGTVWYDDGYGERRYTRFCHRYHGASHTRYDFDLVPGPPRQPPPIVIDAQKARYHEQGNDSN